MRIIAGTKRGMSLLSLPGEEITRPTTDRVKEALFGAIQFQIYDSIVLDLFSGSGALGLEAVSRGAQRAFLVERDGKAAAIIHKNIQKAGFADRAELMMCDYRQAIASLAAKGVQVDIALLDPPYQGGYYQQALQCLREEKVLAHGAIVVLEHLRAQPIPPVEGYEFKKTKHYGKTSLTFLEREEIL